MAILDQPLFSEEAYGTIRHTLTFFPRGERFCLLPCLSFAQAHTPDRLAQKALFRDGVIAWIALSPESKADWTMHATGLQTGFTAFMEEFMSPVECPPPWFVGPSLTLLLNPILRPSWSLVPLTQHKKTLLHFDGDDHSTVVTDALCTPKIWTKSGDFEITTAQKVFGSGSGSFGGTNAFLLTPNHGDFQVGAGDFTLDFRIRIHEAPPTTRYIFWYGNDGNWYNSLCVFLSSSRIISASIYDSSAGNVAICSTPLTLDTWTHFAAVRNASDLRVYFNGTSDGFTTANKTVGVPSTAPTTQLGAGYGATYRQGYFKGWLDEFCFLKGVPRWTSDFTPPSLPYTP